MAGLFQVLWGAPGGKFKEASVLKGTDQEPLIIPGGQGEKTCTRPTAVDWNGDGKLDLIVGNYNGTFFLFTGEGNGKFEPKAEPLMAGASPLRINGGHGDPVVVDWDGDGDLDILSGSGEGGGVYWAENTAGAGKPPALKQFTTLIKPGPAFQFGQLLKESDLNGPAGNTRIWVDDVNGDGKLDILVGDRVTLVSMAKGISKKEYSEKVAQWKSGFDAAVKATNEARNDEERDAAQKKLNALPGRADFMKEESTGYVWLYKRK